MFIWCRQMVCTETFLAAGDLLDALSLDQGLQNLGFGGREQAQAVAETSCPLPSRGAAIPGR